MDLNKKRFTIKNLTLNKTKALFAQMKISISFLYNPLTKLLTNGDFIAGQNILRCLKL